MNLIPEIEASHEEIKALRRTIHAHPELRYEEVGTAKLVAENLERWGLEVHRGMGKTGVVGVLKRGSGKRYLGLRADMDALPIAEINTFGHRSQNEGRMHACGHDGHTAMLLGRRNIWLSTVNSTARLSSFSSRPRKAERAPRR